MNEVEERTSQQQHLEEMERAEWVKILNDPTMLYFFHKLFEMTHFYDSYMDLNTDQKNVAIGMREVAIQLKNFLEQQDPHVLYNIQKEAVRRQELYRLAAEADEEDNG